MIVGSGLLAKAFKEFVNDEEILIFASGVSNSLETGKKEFQRESNLLLNTIRKYPDKKLVYFSTYSIFEKKAEHRFYVNHKLEMERLIQKESKHYFIFRLTNIVGPGGNKSTILNYLVSRIKNEKVINLWKNATRNILDVDDLLLIVKNILKGSESKMKINIANINSFKVSEIISQLEMFFKKAAILNLIDKGESIQIDISEVEDDIKKVLTPAKQSIEYISLLLIKYYSK